MRNIDNEKLLQNLDQSVDNLIAYDSSKKYLWIDTTKELLLAPTTTSISNGAYRALGNLYTQGLFSTVDHTKRDDVQLVEAIIKAFSEKVNNETDVQKQIDLLKKLNQLSLSLLHLQNHYSHLPDLKAKYNAMEKTVNATITAIKHKIETVISLLDLSSIEENVKQECENAIKGSQLNKQEEQIKLLTSLKDKLEKDFRKFDDKPIVLEKCTEIKRRLDYTIDSISRVVKNKKEKENMIKSFLELQLSNITDESQYKEALSLVRAAFLELYRESSEQDSDFIKETLIQLVASATHQGSNQFGNQLIEYINKNLKIYNSRPTSSENIKKQDRAIILNNAASMIGLPEDQQGGQYLNGMRFINHKLKAFWQLYDHELNDDLKGIVQHLISQTDPIKQRILYHDFPRASTRQFSLKDYDNKKYFPVIDPKIEMKLINAVDKFLQQLNNNPLAKDHGILFPAGFSRHFAPISIKQNKEEYHLLLANAGAASTGESQQVESPQHAKLIHTKDTEGSGNGKVKVGEVVTEYGPYSLAEIKKILMNAAMLLDLRFELKDDPIYEKYANFLQDEMEINSFKNLLDPNKKLKHEVMDDQTFQVIGNCFLKNIDLLVKDCMATYALGLKKQNKLEDAIKANELLNVYHQELMVKKQTDTSNVIPEKKAFNLAQNKKMTVNFDNLKKSGKLNHADANKKYKKDNPNLAKSFVLI